MAPTAAAIAGFLLLDFAVYLLHRLFHVIPALWRLHRVHHSDHDLDVTTALRFHPAEVIISVAVQTLVIVTAGIPANAVIVFAVVLNGAAMFNHSNVYLPDPVDRVLRWLIVTPNMHHIHHSVLREEQDRNYGFFISCWDRLFSSYLQRPRAGREHIEFGIAGFDEPRGDRLERLLLQPFRNGRVQ